MAKNLNAANDKQVSSAKTLDVFIGTPPKRLLIFTGIAIPEWDSKSNLDSETVIVNLNEKSNTKNPPFAATVGLASIYNADSDLVFATDEVTVYTDDQLNLMLACNIAVLGEPSVLSRFSYHATVFLDTDEAIITGAIRWDPRDMTHNAAIELDLFEIEAFTMKAGPAVAGTSFGTTIRTVEKVGQTLGKPAREGNLLSVPYEISEPPLEEALMVSVTPKPGAFVVNSDATFNFVQVSGPSPITLSLAHLTETPVDFMALQYVGPR